MEILGLEQLEQKRDETIRRYKEAEEALHPEARERWEQVTGKPDAEPVPEAKGTVPASEEVIAEQVKAQARLWLDIQDTENRLFRTDPEHCWCDRCHPLQPDTSYERVLLAAERDNLDYIVRHIDDGLGDSYVGRAMAIEADGEWLEPTGHRRGYRKAPLGQPLPQDGGELQGRGGAQGP